MTDLPRVLVCDELHEDGKAILRDAARVDVRTGMSTAELQATINRYHGVVVGPDRYVPHDVIEEAMNLRVIGCAGSRLDKIDVTTARAKGIEVRNSPGSNAVAIAEHAMQLMLRLGTRLAGKTLGIIGFGRIGRELARRAQAFDMIIIVNQPRLTPELALDHGVVVKDLKEVLQESDFVSLHVPFKEETRALIGREELRAMRIGAYLVNTGHTDLVDDYALLSALEAGRLAGAALPEIPAEIDSASNAAAAQVRQHRRVIVAPHVTRVIGDRKRETAVDIARQVVATLRIRRPNETLALEIVSMDTVRPHEEIDEKRVERLVIRLQEESRLINPPVVTEWDDHYVILDGATRFSALRRLGFPHIAVQLVDPVSGDAELHTWYHVISSADSVEELFGHLKQIEGLSLQRLPTDELQTAFDEHGAICYFLDRDGQVTLAMAEIEGDRLALMRAIVTGYSEWGRVERTLLTDIGRLRGQFPDMAAAAVFPQFDPADVFRAASQGRLLPAGLTRFVIPGRILRLNLDLEQLRASTSLAEKRAWFNQFLAEKLARSRLRYYQEPVILLDE